MKLELLCGIQTILIEQAKGCLSGSLFCDLRWYLCFVREVVPVVYTESCYHIVQAETRKL
jgi:hypothetical protein